ncbi:3D domain-containing protein [Patescibacteria group bacterium]|nr:3D domain-containing protein [Patescibacteria group bacterium]
MKHKKLKKLHNVEKKVMSATQKALIILVEIALICDFSIYPLPVNAAELEIVGIDSNAEFSLEDKIIEMETSPDEINKALQMIEERERIVEDEIRANRERLEIEMQVFKDEQARLEQIEEQEIKELEQVKKETEQAIKDKQVSKQAKPVKKEVQNQDQPNATIIELPRGVKVYAKTPASDNKEYKVLWSDYRTFTGYNSDPWQTDDTPCIAANGFDVCQHGIEDTVAANFLPFGTKIRIPEKFGDRIFIVRDRMNRRYPNSVDIWMIYKEDARAFGRRSLRMEVVEEIE